MILRKNWGKMKLISILMEGGGSLNWSALQSGIVQKVQAYIAPKLFGGETAKTAVEGTGVDFPDEGFFSCRTAVSFLWVKIL